MVLIRCIPRKAQKTKDTGFIWVMMHCAVFSASRCLGSWPRKVTSTALSPRYFTCEIHSSVIQWHMKLCLLGVSDKSVLFCAKFSGVATLWSLWYFQQRAETWANTSTAVMVFFHSWGFFNAICIPLPRRNHSSLPVLQFWRLPADSYRFLGKYLQLGY